MLFMHTLALNMRYISGFFFIKKASNTVVAVDNKKQVGYVMLQRKPVIYLSALFFTTVAYRISVCLCS